jgi:streptomycin 6-kinase
MIRFPQTILDLFGERGRSWLDALPGLIAELEQRWNITVFPPFNNLSYNYVAPAVCKDGTPVVLKMGVPAGILDTELAALALYAGRGMVRLLTHDASVSALLLERLQPGTPLAHMEDDDEATRIAARVFQQVCLPLAMPHPFPTIENITGGLVRLRTTFDGGCGPFPQRLINRAEGLFTDLLSHQGPPVLLHGDLHHWNILQSGDEWRAIDPQGFAGEAEYEIGALMRNPIPGIFSWPELTCRQARRIAILSEMLGYDRQRLASWAFAQEILSAWWYYEDHRVVESEWVIARSLEPLCGFPPAYLSV